MAYLDINGFNLHYERFDHLTAENVLLIHGNLASNEWWHPSIEVWKKTSTEDKKSTLLCADWRGYGKSKGIQDESEICFEKFADDYIQLIESNELKDVHVVGHSTGGLIAMMAILKRPELFKSCVFLDSVGPKGLELEFPLDQVLAHFQQMSINKDYCFQVLAATIDGVDASSSLFQNIANVTWQADKPMFTGVPRILANEIDIVNRMHELKLPTLVLHGSKDMVLPLKGSEELHRQLPHSQLDILEGAGHSYNVENPEGFVEKLESFWQGLHSL